MITPLVRTEIVFEANRIRINQCIQEHIWSIIYYLIFPCWCRFQIYNKLGWQKSPKNIQMTRLKWRSEQHVNSSWMWPWVSRWLKFCVKIFHSYLHGRIHDQTKSFELMPRRGSDNRLKIHISNATKDVRFNSFFIRFAALYREIDPELICTNPVDFTNAVNSFNFSLEIP